MEHSWMMGLIGGLMIGSAAAIYMLVNGRIMGASGIVGELVDGSGRGSWAERSAFIAGLVALPFLLKSWLPDAATHVTDNWLLLVVGGIFVGLGTRLANGCTSGHGVCGIARLSPRGIVATLIYIGAGGTTMLVLRHWAGVL